MVHGESTIKRMKDQNISQLIKQLFISDYHWPEPFFLSYCPRPVMGGQKLMDCGNNQDCHGCQLIYLLSIPTKHKVLYFNQSEFLKIQIQGISEKCTGAFKFRCRLISIEFTKKIFILCSNFITNIEYVNIYLIQFNHINKYFRVIFISIILNVHNDPCFEDKSSSLSLKYHPVHFSETSCTLSHLPWRRPCSCRTWRSCPS